LRIFERPYYFDIGEVSFDSFWSAFYLCIITATTIGYGAVYACTPCGRAVTIMIIFFGAIITALLIAIMSESFEISPTKKQALVKITTRTQAARCIIHGLDYNLALSKRRKAKEGKLHEPVCSN